MKIEIPFIDRHGLPVELNQRIAIKVLRIGNSNRDYFWVPGHIELYYDLSDRHQIRLYAVLDLESVFNLENVSEGGKPLYTLTAGDTEMSKPEFFDSKNIPEPGGFERAEV